jgi:hypothetical protein
VVALAVVGAAAWFLLLRDGGVLGGGGDHPVADFSFTFGKVAGTAVGEKASEDVLQDAAEGVRETLDAMYVAGYIDPSKWEEGTYPEVIEAFAGPAQKQAAAEISSFSLGGEYGRVEFVDPEKGRLNVRVLVDPDGVPTGAVATTTFGAAGELTDGRKIEVTHVGTYYLHPDGDRWLIVGYDVGGGVGPAAGGAQETPS